MRFLIVFVLRAISVIFIMASFYFTFWGRWKLAIAMLGGTVIALRAIEWIDTYFENRAAAREEEYDY